MNSFYYIIVFATTLFTGLFLFMYILYRHFIKKIDRQQRENMQAILETQENERRQIALEVHDNLGPLLSITGMQMETLMASKKGDEGKAMQDVYQQMKQAVEICRDISHNLTPMLNTQSRLDEMLSDYINMVNKTKRIAIQFVYDLNDVEIQQQKSASLCRIVQELVTNTLKHANAKNIHILITRQSSWIILTYTDDGKGMLQVSGNGIGIKNIQSRVLLLNGHLSYGQGTSNGIEVKIKIPVNELNQ